MIPALYNKSETTFTHNGVGLLSEAVKATVTEERNGSYELSLQYPITGRFYSEITEGAIIKAKANETSEPQLFRIYKSSKPINGIVTYSAEHISYDLNGIPLLGFSIKNATPQMALTKAIEGAALPCPFTAYSNISTLNSTEILTPCSVRALLGGQTGSLLDIWGGEYEFDNFTVKLYLHRGKDNGVVIEYGKNLKDLKQESNIAECYTHLMPYAVYTVQDESGNSEEKYVYLAEKVIPLTEAEDIGHYKAFIMDFSDRFGDNEEITEEIIPMEKKGALGRIKSTFIGDRAFYQSVVKLLIPIVIQQGITSFVNLLDNVMVGALSTAAISGVAIVNQLIFVFNLSIFGSLSGPSIYSAQYAGVGDDEGVKHCFRFKMIIGTLISVAAVLVFALFGENLIWLYLNEEVNTAETLAATLEQAKDYMYVMLWGLPPFMLGLNWSSTERMSSQQADMLTSEITALRRTLEPAVGRICTLWLRMHGYDCGVTVDWEDINLQDEVEEAKAALYLQQARKLKQENDEAEGK